MFCYLRVGRSATILTNWTREIYDASYVVAEECRDQLAGKNNFDILWLLRDRRMVEKATGLPRLIDNWPSRTSEAHKKMGKALDHNPERSLTLNRSNAGIESRIAVLLLTAIVACVAVVPVWAQSTPATPSRSIDPVIQTEDVERFYRVYAGANSQPTAEQLQHDYLDVGTQGLHQLAKMRNVSGATMAAALAARPQIYSDAKRCLAVLPRVRERLKNALRELGNLYPDARFPPVTIAVGRGKPVGIGSPATGVQIGLETLCATNWLTADVEARFVHVIAHEYVHVQQVQALVDDEHPTVLSMSLIEGAADFVGELISGDVAYAYLKTATKGREKEIETAFVADMKSRDLSNWLYNSKPEKPGDLGYWVGYRIVKSYYQHANDKHQALREIIGMNDPERFLANSGWYPGIKLE
jgi:hypothetical protein